MMHATTKSLRFARWLALVCWIVICGVRAAGPPSGLDALRSNSGDAGFALANEPREFEFPQDHGPHPQFRNEWWYVTGNLDSKTGERFGFELTFFRVALAPPAVPQSGAGMPSHWRTRQVYLAHFAITDVARGQFRFAQKVSRDALGLAGAQAHPFHVWLDDWALTDSPGGWTLHADGQGYGLTLDAQPILPPVLNGEHGLSRKSSESGTATYYYSIPRIAVHGKLARGSAVSDVQGLAWLDREWGTGSLGMSQQGWDWFALQFKDGSALMFYALRNHAGTRDPHSAGTWVDPSGNVRALSTEQVNIEVLDHWSSPRGGEYPSRWRVRVPALDLDIEASPVLQDQELASQPPYWEGAVDIRGTRNGRDAPGRGYVELVGYGR